MGNTANTALNSIPLGRQIFKIIETTGDVQNLFKKITRYAPPAVTFLLQIPVLSKFIEVLLWIQEMKIYFAHYAAVHSALEEVYENLDQMRVECGILVLEINHDRVFCSTKQKNVIKALDELIAMLVDASQSINGVFDPTKFLARITAKEAKVAVAYTQLISEFMTYKLIKDMEKTDTNEQMIDDYINRQRAKCKMMSDNDDFEYYDAVDSDVGESIDPKEINGVELNKFFRNLTNMREP